MTTKPTKPDSGPIALSTLEDELAVERAIPPVSQELRSQILSRAREHLLACPAPGTERGDAGAAVLYPKGEAQ